MGIFAGIENVEQGNSGNGLYIEPHNDRDNNLTARAKYELEVVELTTFQSKEDTNRHYFCATFAVLSTTHPTQSVGDEVTYLVPTNLPQGLFKRKVSELAVALNPGISAADIDEPVMDELTGPKNPTAGTTVSCETWYEISKTKKLPYKAYHWTAGNGASATFEAPETETAEDVPF
jgi:hypothetical protein